MTHEELLRHARFATSGVVDGTLDDVLLASKGVWPLLTLACEVERKTQANLSRETLFIHTVSDPEIYEVTR